MRPYGWTRDAYRDEDYGPPSRFGNTRSQPRREWRRILHKIGRRRAEAEIKEQLEHMEAEDMFKCARCGDICPESTRSPGTDECMYCEEG